MSQYNHHQSLGHLTGGLASRLFNRLLTTRFKDAGIDMTAEQWGGVVLLLRNNGALSQSQICELLYLEKSSVSRSIDGLEKRGWTERKPSPTDSRSKLVVLTEKSLYTVDTCANIASLVLQEAQQNLADADLDNSKQQLSSVVANLRKLNGQI
ncbi:transcriptional regulator, MarR family [Vibrio sp. JCM 18905]|nr:transcriptional regulator, MarR family [Vibrio sp. JCM 18905]